MECLTPAGTATVGWGWPEEGQDAFGPAESLPRAGEGSVDLRAQGAHVQDYVPLGGGGKQGVIRLHFTSAWAAGAG